MRTIMKSVKGRFGNGMSRLAMVCLLVCVAIGLPLGTANAQDLQPLPEVRSPVVDLTSSLTADQVQQLTSELLTFEQRKGSQIAVVFVPTTMPETIEQYAIRLAERVKVGRTKSDDGVLILVAVQDRKTRIEVGYGLEGAIPDIVANQIRREVMNPYFRTNDFYGGVRAGAGALMKRIDGEAFPPPWQGDAKDQDSGDPMSWIIIALAAIFGLGGMLRRAFGRVAASGIVGTVVGGVGWVMSGAALIGGIVGILAFLFALMLLGRVIDFRPGGGSGGWSTGGGGWSGGGGSWSGGGGSFGGGGASGSWDD
jgi:uncharacterized protein